jgi:hypothetical protein
MNNEVLKGMDVACFKLLCQHLPVGTTDASKKHSQDTRTECLGPPGHEAIALTTQLPRSVWQQVPVVATLIQGHWAEFTDRQGVVVNTLASNSGGPVF